MQSSNGTPPQQRPLCVVSLLPSATEIVCAVGGEPLLVGRSHECDHPPSIRDRAVLTAARTKFENSQQMHDAVCATLSKGEAACIEAAHRGRSDLCRSRGFGLQPQKTRPFRAALRSQPPYATLYHPTQTPSIRHRPPSVQTATPAWGCTRSTPP
jgi:hypothetical protein